jgi:hypothetical protein
MKIMTILKKISPKQKGAAVLVFALVLVALSTMIILFAGNYGVLQSKSTTNIARNYQASEAALAGLEFGINYLNQNGTTIIGTPSGGYIPSFTSSSTTNVVLANNAKYSIVYTNPIANDYTLIRITSTGTSDDDAATHTSSILVKYGSLLLNQPNSPMIAKGNIALSGNSQIINTFSPITLSSGGNVTLTGSSSTITSSGVSSTSGSTGADILQNVAGVGTTSNNDFFADYFGVSPNTVKANSALYYSNNNNTNYSGTLNGRTGTSIWIDQTGGTASLSGNTTIGSAANPVVMIVNGDVNITGNVTIYGYVFILGNTQTSLAGNLSIIGGISSTGDISANGSIQVTYSPTTLNNLQNNVNMRYYAKVPGSWRDF